MTDGQSPLASTVSTSSSSSSISNAVTSGIKNSPSPTKSNSPKSSGKTPGGRHHGPTLPQHQQSFSSMSSSSSPPSSTWSTFYANNCYYLLPMLGWFVFSTSLSSYNKIVFGHSKSTHHEDDLFPPDLIQNTTGTGDDNDGSSVTSNRLGFPCPLLMTSIHFLAQWIFSETLCAIWPRYWGATRISSMSWTEYLTVSLPCGLVTSADIGLSNLSYVKLTLTFYTLIKSSTPIFVLFWAQMFGLLERGITTPLVLVIILITLGEYVTVAGEISADDFEWSGFLLCLSAAILSGARWTMVQLKIQSLQPPLKTTVATMRLLAPSMFISLSIASLLIERPWYRLPLYFYQQLLQQQQDVQGQEDLLVAAVSEKPHHYHDQRMLASTHHSYNITPSTISTTTDTNATAAVLPEIILSTPEYFVAMTQLMVLGLIGAFFAIAMILCEFYLIMKTNAIVLTVGGVLKEIITIWVGVFLFGDKFTWRSFWGCCILFAGVLLYKVVFHQQQKQQKLKQQQQQQQQQQEAQHSDIHKSKLSSASLIEVIAPTPADGHHLSPRATKAMMTMSSSSSSIESPIKQQQQPHPPRKNAAHPRGHNDPELASLLDHEDDDMNQSNKNDRDRYNNGKGDYDKGIELLSSKK